MSEELVIRSCAPTLASLKTGNLFHCRCDSRQELYDSVRELNRRLRHKGLRVLPMRYWNGEGLVYVYRPQKLDKDLGHETACKLLKDRGYPCGNAHGCVCCLQKRLNAQKDFPHEIGLFLGYPPEDVDGFIHRKGEAKCGGLWKVYGDVEKAQRTFARYRKCTSVYLKKWADGRDMERLTVKCQ